MNLQNQISIEINATPADVWNALTDPEIIKRYFFGTNAESTWKEGEPVRFHGIYKEQPYEDKGVILENKENKILKYSYWSNRSGLPDHPDNYAIITYELMHDNNSTTLTVTQDNIQSEEAKAHSAASWNEVLKNLKNIVENK